MQDQPHWMDGLDVDFPDDRETAVELRVDPRSDEEVVRLILANLPGIVAALRSPRWQDEDTEDLRRLTERLAELAEVFGHQAYRVAAELNRRGVGLRQLRTLLRVSSPTTVANRLAEVQDQEGNQE